MFINFDLYVEFLVKKKMTANQFAFCWMIHFRDLKNINKYTKAVGGFKNSDIKYLIDEGYLINVRYTDVNKLRVGELSVTPSFTDEILITDEYKAYEELVKVYPKFFMINGKKQLTTAVNEDEMARTYFRKVKGDKIQHKIVLAKTKIVAKMMENNELNPMKIDKYIIGRCWSGAELETEHLDLRREL